MKTTLTAALCIAIFYNLNAEIVPPYPQQGTMLLAGIYLSNHNLEGNIASWNAGIIGYYSGGHIINLDGLVNNSIYPYIKANNVPEYCKQENIRYVFDFMNMWRPPYPKQGGYENPDWIAKTKMSVIAEVPNCWWRYLVIAEMPK